MHARTTLVVGLDSLGRTAAQVVRCEAPWLVRVTSHADPLEVMLVGGAAGPLGGDVLALDVTVGDRARLRVGSVAASLAQPGRPGSGGSTAAITVLVGSGSWLAWWPQPLVSVATSDHEQTTIIGLADESSSLLWVDEVVLGRNNQPGGMLTMHQRVTVGEAPVLHHTVRFSPSDADRVVVTAIRVGEESQPPDSMIEPSLRAARFSLSPTATAWTVLTDDVDRAHKALAALGLDRAD